MAGWTLELTVSSCKKFYLSNWKWLFIAARGMTNDSYLVWKWNKSKCLGRKETRCLGFWKRSYCNQNKDCTKRVFLTWGLIRSRMKSRNACKTNRYQRGRVYRGGKGGKKEWREGKRGGILLGFRKLWCYLDNDGSTQRKAGLVA